MEQRRGHMIRALSTCLLLLLAGPVYAQGAYVGIGAGSSGVDTDPLLAAASKDDKSSILKFLAGYRPFRLLAVEAFFVDLGNYSATGAVTRRAAVEGPGVALLVFLPIAQTADLLLKGGSFRWDMEIVDTAAGTARDHDIGAMYGVGLHLTGPGGTAALRIEYERFDKVGDEVSGIEGLDFNTVTISIIYNF